MSRTVVIADIHGCFQTFQQLLQRIKLTTNDHLILLGDYINKGPQVKPLIDFLIELEQQSFHLTLLKGNHECMLLDVIDHHMSLQQFILAGGNTTLHSFGINHLHELDHRYVSWFRNLKSFHETPTHIYVHAGFNFDEANMYDDERAYYWIRNMNVNAIKSKGRVVVHGHTPKTLSEIKSLISSQSQHFEVCIDNGCIYDLEEKNNLLAFFPENSTIIIQKNIDL
jgi:serine/threonine protein phosphatase 1